MDRSKLFLAVLLICLGVATERLATHRQPEPASIGPLVSAIPNGFVMVKAAVDGDTVELADGTRVRYIGVDTPETVHPSKPVQCFGKEASNFNKSLVEGHPVRLERDISDTDKYGRLLRYVYLEDGTFVNMALITNGYAKISTYPPDVAFARDFQVAQGLARQEKRGLWGGCQ
jgi:micrococcal nuclease